MTSANIKSMTLRVVSLFVAIVFTMTTLCGSPSQAFAFVEAIDLIGGVKTQTELRKDLYAMPAELGSLVSLWEPPAGISPQGFVVQIQDAHANPEGQQNVAGMLKYLETKFPGLVVGLEGAAGKLHPEYLNFFKGFPDANRAVIEDLKQKGELNGAELFLLSKSRTPAREIQVGNVNLEYGTLFGLKRTQVHGVETAELYRDNLRTYRNLLFKRDEMQVLLGPIRTELEKESSQKLNGELRDFFKERSRRKEGRFDASTSQMDPDLQAYVRYLQKQSLKFLGIDLKDSIEQLRFPSLLRIVMIEETRKDFDPEKAGDQWKKAIQSIKSAAKDSDEKEFVRALVTFGHEKGFIPKLEVDAFSYPMERVLYPRKLLEGLFRFAQKHQLSFAGQEAFWKSWKLVVFQAEIDTTELLAEMNTLEEGLVQKLARSEDEKALIQKLGNFDLLEKTLRLELNRQEYNKALLNQDELRSFAENSKPLTTFLDQAYRFYDVSVQRDEALVTNLLSLAPKTGNKEKLFMALYSGGFHTSGIEERLRARNIGYAVFSPNITKTDHGEMYQKVMSDANADLSTYFEARNPFATKQEAIFFKELLEVAAPVLFDKYRVNTPEIAGRVKQAVESHPILSKALNVQFLGKDQNASLHFQTRSNAPEVTLRNASVMPMALTGENSSIDGKMVTLGPVATLVSFYPQEVLGLRAEPESSITTEKALDPSAQTIMTGAEVATKKISESFLRETQSVIRAEMRVDAISGENEPSRAQKMADEFAKLIFLNGGDIPAINLWKIFTITEMFSILDGMRIPIAKSLSFILEKLQAGDIVTASQSMSELLARLILAPQIVGSVFVEIMKPEWMKFSLDQRDKLTGFITNLKKIGLVTPESLSLALEKVADSDSISEKSIELLEYAEKALRDLGSLPFVTKKTIQKIKKILLKHYDDQKKKTQEITINIPEEKSQGTSPRSEMRTMRSIDVYLPLIEAETSRAVEELHKQGVWKNVVPEMVNEILESMPFEHLSQVPLKRLLKEVLLTMALTEEYWTQGLGRPYFLTTYQTDLTDPEEKELHTEIIFTSDHPFLEGDLQSELSFKYPVARGEKIEISVWGNGRSAEPSFHFHVLETWIEKKAQKKFSLNPDKLQAVFRSQPKYRVLQSEMLVEKYGLLERLDAIEKAIQQKATLAIESGREIFESATEQKTLLIKGAAGAMPKVVLGEAAEWEPSNKRINISMVRPYDLPEVAAVKIHNETAAFQKIAGSLLEKEAESKMSLSRERTRQIFEAVLKKIHDERIFAQVALQYAIQEVREQGEFEDLDPTEKRAIRFFQDEVLPALEQREDIIFDDAQSSSVALIRLNQERFGTKLFEKILKLPFGFNTEDAKVIEMERTLAVARRGAVLGASLQDPSVSIIDVIMNSIAESQRGLSPKIAIQRAIEKHIDPFWMMYKKKVEEDAHPSRMTVRNFEFVDQIRNFWLSISDEMDTYDFIHEPNATEGEIKEAKTRELSKHQRVFAETLKGVTQQRPAYEAFDQFMRREINAKGRPVGYLTAHFFFEYYQKMKAAKSLGGENPSMGDLKASDDDLLNFLMRYYDYAEYGFEDANAETPYVVFAQNIRDEIDYNSLRSRFRRRGRIVAIVTPDGTLLSHYAIFAQKEGIIAVPAANFAAAGIDITQIKAGTLTLVDGKKGEVALSPSDELREQWLRRGERYATLENFYFQKAREPVFFAGKKIVVGADEAAIETVDAKNEGETRIYRYGADFIGLMRLEEFFLHMREQYVGMETDSERLALALRKFIDSPFFKKSNRPLIVRLYDPQGDKLPPKAWWGKNSDGKNRTIADIRKIVAKNRSIHFYIDSKYPEFSEYGVMQIQAVVTAYIQEQRHKSVQLLIPDVANESDITAIENLVERAKDELEPAQKEKADLPVGFMYERQGAYLSPKAKFYGIGSNDLLQNILGLSRDDPKASSRLRQLNPKLVQEIYRVGNFGGAHSIPVTLEGEWAGSRRMMLMLLLMSLNDVRVTPVMKLAKIPELKEFVRNIDSIKLQTRLGNYFKRAIRGDATLSADEFDRATQSFVDEVEESIIRKPEYLAFARKQKELFEREKLKKELTQLQNTARAELRTFVTQETSRVAAFGPFASGEHAIRSLISSKQWDLSGPKGTSRSEMRMEPHGKQSLLAHPEYGMVIRHMIDSFFLEISHPDFQGERSFKKLAGRINTMFNDALKSGYRPISNQKIEQYHKTLFAAGYPEGLYHAISRLKTSMRKMTAISSEKVWGQDKYGNIEEMSWGNWLVHDMNNFLMTFLGFLGLFEAEGDPKSFKMALQTWEEIDLWFSFCESIGKSMQNGSFFERLAAIRAKTDKAKAEKTETVPIKAGDSKENYLKRDQMPHYFGQKIFIDSPLAQQNREHFFRIINQLELSHREMGEYVQKIKTEYEKKHGPVSLEDSTLYLEIKEHVRKIKELYENFGLKETTPPLTEKPAEEETGRSEMRQLEDRLRVAKLLEDTINNKTTALQPETIKITSREAIKKSIADLLGLFQVSEMTVAGMPFVTDIIGKFKSEINELEQWKKRLGDREFLLQNEHREAIALLAQRIVLKNNNEIMPWLKNETPVTNQETMPAMRQSKIIKRILVAEDEAGIRSALETLLRSMGYTVIPAENGQKAFELLKKNDFDFLITDFKMPGLTGGQLLKAMASGELPQKIPAILMSGYSLKILEEEIKKSGMENFDFSELKKGLDVELVTKPNIMGPILSTLKKYGGPEQARSAPDQGAVAAEEKTINRSEMRKLSPAEVIQYFEAFELLVNLDEIKGIHPFVELLAYSRQLPKIPRLERLKAFQDLTREYGGDQRYVGISPEDLIKNPEKWDDIFNNKSTPVLAFIQMWDNPAIRSMLMSADAEMENLRKNVVASGHYMFLLDYFHQEAFQSTNRSEIRSAAEVERPLDMSPEEAAGIKKIFVFGPKGIGFEKLGEDAILYVLFVEQVLKKFPNAEIHMAIDYANLFSREHFRGKVFPVIDPAYELKRQKKEDQESFEPQEGILTHVNVSDGAILEAMDFKLKSSEEWQKDGGYKKLGEWLKASNYDMVFDFTGVGRGLQSFFENNPDKKNPVIFSHMNTVVQRTAIGDKTGDRPVTILDSSGLRDVKGTGEVGGLTRDGTRPGYWEKTHRVYRELGLYESGLDLQLLNGWGMPLSEVEKRWVLETVKGMFIKKRLDPQTVLTGREKFVYVNIFSQGNSGSIAPDMWVKLLSEILEKQDVYLIFSQGGFKDQKNQPVLKAILEELSRVVGSSKTHFLLEAPENISVGRVQEIMQTMDLVITPDTGFSHLATASNIPQVEFMMLPAHFSQWGTYRKNSMIVDSEFLENLSQYPEAGYEVIQRFIRDSLDASVPPRRRRALNLVDFPISQKSSDQNVLQRSELRQSESKNLEREPGEIQNDILKLNERIVTEMERMSLRALQTRDMKENREARSLYKTFNNMTKKTLRDHYAGLEDLEFAKRQLESFMASRFRPATFEKADRKKTPLDVLDNHLGNLIKNRENIDEFYQELGNNRYARFSGNVENHAILDYIRTTSAVWMIDFRRFIDTIPEQQGDFRERLVSFLTPLGAWFLKPADIPVLKEQRPEYVAAILNKLHKYERTASGEIISRPLEAQDMIGANHRREIFHLAEGLDFMIEASKNLKFSQSELPLFRSEMRVVGTEAFKTSLSKTVSLVDSLPVSSEIIFAAEHMGTYSAEDIAAELEGGITEDNVRKSRLWITMKLLETMSSARQEGKITNKRLQQFLDEVMASVPDMVRAAISRNTVDGPKFHVNLKGLDERQWSEFIRDFPVVLGMLVTLHASLSINVDAEGEALQSIKKKFNDLMTQEGITLTSGQLHIVSATGRNPFPSFNGREKANAFMARDKNLLLRRKNVLSYWITEDEGHMAQLTAGIATALLEVVSDAHLNAANTYKPSDYATLLATVINAIQGYLQIQVAA